MMTLVIGGSGSGKSEYAEGLVLQYPPERRRFYLATMQVYGEEGQRRVARHRALRQGKGFETLELTSGTDRAIRMIREKYAGDPAESVLLLECVSNLTANEMFDRADGQTGLVERVCGQLEYLCDRVGDVIIVSNNIFEDGIGYDPMTMAYMEALGRINAWLAGRADRIVEVVAGIPLELKP